MTKRLITIIQKLHCLEKKLEHPISLHDFEQIAKEYRHLTEHYQRAAGKPYELPPRKQFTERIYHD